MSCHRKFIDFKKEQGNLFISDLCISIKTIRREILYFFIFKKANLYPFTLLVIEKIIWNLEIVG